MNAEPLEIERKFLIEYPDINLLAAKSSRIIDITQTYLAGTENGVSRRVRKSVENGLVKYTKNEKRRINSVKRIEMERAIQQSEYFSLMRTADRSRRTISKTRYCIPMGELTAEVDVYAAVTDFAICEVELKREDAEFALPEFLDVIREVTDEPEFTNAQMAKEMPTV